MGHFGGDGARRVARWMLAYSEVMSIAALMVVPPLLGLLADLQFKISPWGVVLGAGLGVGSGIARLVRWSESISRGVPRGREPNLAPPEHVLPEVSQPPVGANPGRTASLRVLNPHQQASSPAFDRAGGQLGQTDMPDR